MDCNGPLLARSKAGKDKGTLYLVLERTEDAVLLTDGKRRKLRKPKRKNRKHVEFLPGSAEEALSGKLREPRTDAGIRRALAAARMSRGEAENDQGGT